MCDSSKCIPLIPLEGAQLLCMTGKGLDACRYLQTYGSWTTAAWLAKVFQESPVTQTTFPNVNSCPYSLLSYFYFQVTHAHTRAHTHVHTHTHIHTYTHVRICVCTDGPLNVKYTLMHVILYNMHGNVMCLNIIILINSINLCHAM